MAYVNVAEWKTDQVCEWLKGLENSVLPYVHSFTNHGVSGQQLLSLRPDDLERLGVLKLGHQEIILEAVEHLRNFHYELDRENLQLLALRLSCQARSLCNELSGRTDTLVATQTLSDVASVVTAVKPLVRWLDRPPFSGQLDYNEKKTRMMKLSLEMATCAQRDRFAEKPIEEIRSTCEQLAQLADYIVQDIADPMILQPASLDLATLKKRPTGDDLGFYVLPSFHGAHQIAEIKFGSAAHQCGKMEEGDEIVQVNYQTVVGWERKNVLELFRESPSEILLTLKRRPRHTKVYGQIYIKPYRLPSNKKTPYTTRWQHNLPSPRPELLTIPDFTMPLPRHTPVAAAAKPSPSPEPMLDSMATCTDDESSGSDCEVEQPELLSIPPHTVKPSRTVRIRRRATITGASPTTKHGIDIERFWREFKQERNTTFQLRDKAASCAHGLDGVSSTTTATGMSCATTNLRPQTCLGIEQRQTIKKKKKSDDEETKSSAIIVTEEKSVPEKLSEGNDKSVEATGGTKTASNEANNGDKVEQVVTKGDQTVASENHEALSPDSISSKSTGGSDVTEKHKSHDSADLIIQNGTVQIPVTSTVARRVSDIEKYIAKNNESVMIEKVSSTPTQSNEINHTDRKSLSADAIHTDVFSSDGQTKSDDSIDSGHENTTSVSSDISVRMEGSNSKLSTRESSEDKSDSMSSCIENTCESGSSEGDQNSLRAFGKILRSIDRALTEHEKLIEKNMPAERPAYIDAVKAIEEKPTPPEPPPRKYFSKPAVPERTTLRRDSKKLESERFDGMCGNFIDESTTEPIHDEPVPIINEQKSALTSDNFPCIEHHRGRYQIPSVRDDRSLEKYEPFIEKFGPKSTVPTTTEGHHPHVYYQYEPAPPPPPRHSAFRSPDSIDGSVYSKQHQDSSEGSRFGRVQPAEKDRGSVVNKAMMVARSIGRHGNGSKSHSANSPRGARKHNNSLAKKRNVSVKDVGTGDLEGWLTYRSRGAGGAWARAWFILKRSSLYRFRAQDSTKADCLIALTGFTVSQALEVKSRKYAFKIYHTGTVFYFAADTEDSLLIWLDAVEKATLAQRDAGTQHQRNSELFSETDEDTDDADHHHECDGDYGTKGKTSGLRIVDNKQQTTDKSTGFGSLRKVASKDSSHGAKEHREISGSSLDRKYLRFLGGVSKNQNVPVPTAQFRSYRRVLPTSTPMKNKDTLVHSADPQMTIAGSTFYGSSISQNLETSNSANHHDMSDYRRTTEGRYFNGQNRRPSDDLQEFITLEEFMLSQQQQQRQHRVHRAEEEEQRTFMTNNHRSESPASVTSTPSAGVPDHTHYRNYEEGALSPYDVYPRDMSRSNSRRLVTNHSNGRCSPYYTSQQQQQQHQQQQYYRPNDHDCRLKKEPAVPSRDFEPTHKRFFRNGTAGSSDDLTAFLHHRNTAGDTLQRVKKETMAVTRKGSFNLRRRDHAAALSEEQQQRCWIDSLKRSGSSCDKKSEKNRLKNAAQYQPPPNPASQLQFDKPEKMRAAFEMHLDKAIVAERAPQKPNRLKSLFGSKSHQKPCTLDIPKDTSAQKTLLGSPILHRALCRNKSSPQQPHRLSSSVRQTNDNSGHSPAGDSGIGGGSSSIASFVSENECPRALSQSISSVSSSSAISPDWSPDSQPSNALTVSKYNANHHSPSLSSPSPSVSTSLRNSLNPPTLPYIPPPTSPPPPIFDDYPGLEYPPVFEPGTYSLTDASLLRNRNKSHHHHQRHAHQDNSVARDGNCDP